MKFPLVISLVLFTIMALGQGKKLKEDKGVMDQFKLIHIPDDAIWLGADDALKESYKLLDDRLLIYNFWNPDYYGSYQVLKELEVFAQENKGAEVLHFYHPALEVLDQESIYRIWRELMPNKPLIIGVNKQIAQLNLDPMRASVIYDFQRSGGSVLEYAKFKAKKDIFTQTLDSNRLELSSVLSFSRNKISNSSLFVEPHSVAFKKDEMSLFISDRYQNRIVEVNSENKLVRTIGSGVAGFYDGLFATAKFNQPCDIEVDEENQCLYVLDKGNHSIRKVDFKTNKVVTVLGTGEIGTIMKEKLKSGRDALRYPSAIKLAEGELFIAFRELNKVYKMNLLEGSAEWYAGNGFAKSTGEKNKEYGINDPVDLEVSENGLLVLQGNSQLLEVGRKKTKLLFDNENKKVELRKVLSAENLIYVSDQSDGLIKILDSGGDIIDTLEIKDELKNLKPKELSMIDGNLVFTSATNNGIYVTTNAGYGITKLMDLKYSENFYIEQGERERRKYSFKAELAEGFNTIEIGLMLPDEILIDTMYNNRIALAQGSQGQIISLDKSTGNMELEVSSNTDLGYSVIEYEFFSKETDLHPMKKYSFSVFIEYPPFEKLTVGQSEPEGTLSIKVPLKSI